MSDRSKLINRLLHERDFRAAYIRAKLDVLIPSQLRALRDEKTQLQIAEETGMKQARISAMETPGLVNFNRETLVRMAATHDVGLVVKFVPFSEMLEWENSYSQDAFNPTRLAHDIDFLQPAKGVRRRARRNRTIRRMSGVRTSQVPVTTAGIGASTYTIPVQRERVQLKLQFEPAEQPPAQSQISKVITLPNRSGGSVVNNLPIQRAAAAGAGGNYGY